MFRELGIQQLPWLMVDEMDVELIVKNAGIVEAASMNANRFVALSSCKRATTSCTEPALVGFPIKTWRVMVSKRALRDPKCA